MADSDNEQALLLAFKESGVEFVEEARKAVGELGDAFKDVDTAAQQAVEVLKSESTVVQDLKDKIEAQKKELEALAETRKAGLIEQSRYKEQSDTLIHSISENETVLKRLTAAETDKARIDAEATIALGKITKALNDLEDEEERELIEAQKVAEAHYKMMEAADAAAGTTEDHGLKGLAAAAIKGEKAVGMLASGAGLGRLPSMLEGVTSALGLAGGAGMAAGGLILAFESIIPKVEAFIEKITGAAEAAKRAAEQIKEAEDQMAKFMAQQTEEEAGGAKAVKGLLAGRGGVLVSQGIEQALRQQGFGLMSPEERAISETFVGPEATAEVERKQQDQAVAIRRAAIMRDLMAGRTPAISEVSGMAGQFPGLFPEGTEQRFRQALPENIEAAKKQAREAEEGSRRADEMWARQQEATKENLAIQKEFDKVLHQQRADEDKQFESTMRSDEDFNKQLERQRIRSERQAEQSRRRKETEARRQTRENTPEALQRRAIAEERGQILSEAEQQNQMRAQFGGMEHPAFEAGDLQQVVAAVGRNRMMNSQLGFTLAQQVDFYMGQLEAKMVTDFVKGMGQQDRSMRNVNPYAGL
jgi:hypothetical protein